MIRKGISFPIILFTGNPLSHYPRKGARSCRHRRDREEGNGSSFPKKDHLSGPQHHRNALCPEVQRGNRRGHQLLRLSGGCFRQAPNRGVCQLPVLKKLSLSSRISSLPSRTETGGDTIERLSHLGFPVYVIDPKGWKGILETIEHMGDAFGKQEESKRIVSSMIKKKDRIVFLARSLPRPKVFFQMGLSPVVTWEPTPLRTI